MKRLLRYLVALLIVLVCIYGFWAWLQYKGATVIKQTTTSIVTELAKIDKLETVKKHFIKTIQGEQELANLLPDMNADQIIHSALFKDKMVLDVEGDVSAGYMIHDIITGAIEVSRDGTVSIVLGEPQMFGVLLTGTSKSSELGIVTKSDIDMENTLRAKAGELMIQDALSGNILETAKDNAQYVLQNLFLRAGIQIKEVIIKGTGDSQATEPLLK